MESIDQVIERADESMKRAAIEPHADGPHTMRGALVYHYTDAEGLRGILGDGDLRVTNIHYFNDPTETIYGRELCQSFVENKLNSFGSSQMRNLWDKVAELFIVGESNLFPYELQFGTSFSLHGDVLSQWRAYSDSCRGFSLGFSASDLLDRFHRISKAVDENAGPWPYPFRVLYEPREQIEYLGKVAKPAETAWPTVCDLEKGQSTKRNELAARLALRLAIASYCLKAPGFREEMEVRVMYINIGMMRTSGTRLPVRMRSKNGLLVPYRYLGLPGTEGELLPLREIVMGPALDSRRTTMALEMLLESSGYTGNAKPDIVESSTKIASQ